MTSSTKLGVLEAEMHAHFKADELGFERINRDTSEIKDVLRSMATDLKSAVERIHSRVDDEASKARHALNNANQVMQSEVSRMERDSGVVAKDLNDRIAEQKVWVLSGVVTVALAIVGWFADHFFGGKS